MMPGLNAKTLVWWHLRHAALWGPASCSAASGASAASRASASAAFVGGLAVSSSTKWRVLSALMQRDGPEVLWNIHPGSQCLPVHFVPPQEQRGQVQQQSAPGDLHACWQGHAVCEGLRLSRQRSSLMPGRLRLPSGLDRMPAAGRCFSTTGGGSSKENGQAGGGSSSSSSRVDGRSSPARMTWPERPGRASAAVRGFSRDAELGDDQLGLAAQLGGFNRQGTPTFEVFEFYRDREVMQSRRQRSAEELGLEPRDVSLFRSDNKLAPQRATIAPRDGVILVRTEVARAMIFPHKAVLFVGRRSSERETLELASNILRGIQAPGNLPFELVVLEALLKATVDYFSRQHGALKWMMSSVTGDSGLEDSKPFGAFDKAQMVIPIQKFMTSIKNDIKETSEAIEEILDDSDALRDLCLTEAAERAQHQPKAAPPGAAHMRPAAPVQPPGQRAVTPHVKLASNMLETYDRQVLSIESSLLESEEGLETQRQLWHMQLDSSRNHIILFNMYLSMASISIMAATLVPAFFGMNLETGLGEGPPVFYGMLGVSFGIMLCSFPAVQKLYHSQYRRVVHHELADFKTLRLFLIRHMDDLDDIYGVLIRLGNMPRKVARQEFAALLGEALGRERGLSTTSVNLLYKMYCNQRTDELQAEVRHMRSLVRNPDIYQGPLAAGLMDDDELAQVGRLRQGLTGAGPGGAWARLRSRTRGLLYGWERRS